MAKQKQVDKLFKTTLNTLHEKNTHPIESSLIFCLCIKLKEGTLRNKKHNGIKQGHCLQNLICKLLAADCGLSFLWLHRKRL